MKRADDGHSGGGGFDRVVMAHFARDKELGFLRDRFIQ